MSISSNFFSFFTLFTILYSCNQMGYAQLEAPVDDSEIYKNISRGLLQDNNYILSSIELAQNAHKHFVKAQALQEKPLDQEKMQDVDESQKDADNELRFAFKLRHTWCKAVIDEFKYPFIRLRRLKATNDSINLALKEGAFILYFPQGNNTGKVGYEKYKYFSLTTMELSYLSLPLNRFFSENAFEDQGSNDKRLCPLSKGTVFTSDGKVVLPGGLIPAMAVLNNFARNHPKKAENSTFLTLSDVVHKLRELILAFACKYHRIYDYDCEVEYPLFTANEVQFMARTVGHCHKEDYDSLSFACDYICNAFMLLYRNINREKSDNSLIFQDASAYMKYSLASSNATSAAVQDIINITKLAAKLKNALSEEPVLSDCEDSDIERDSDSDTTMTNNTES